MADTTSTQPPRNLAEFQKNFGQRVAILRKEKGLTQEQLAHKLKVDPVYVAFLEGAKRKPSFTTIFKLSTVLEVHPSDLFRS